MLPSWAVFLPARLATRSKRRCQRSYQLSSPRLWKPRREVLVQLCMSQTARNVERCRFCFSTNGTARCSRTDIRRRGIALTWLEARTVRVYRFCSQRSRCMRCAVRNMRCLSVRLGLSHLVKAPLRSGSRCLLQENIGTLLLLTVDLLLPALFRRCARAATHEDEVLI